MMPQQEGSSAIQKLADPAYERYEGNQTTSASFRSETPDAQDLREGLSGKVYPLPRDNTNVLCFALTVIALGLVLLFGVLFVVVIGGTTGWASFAVACFTLLIVASIAIIAIKTR